MQDAPTANAGEVDEESSLLIKGNPLRLRGGITAALGSVVAFLLMAHDGQLRFGVPLGFVGVAIAAWGVMDLLGTFDDGDEHVAHSTTLRALRMPIAQAVAMGLLYALATMGAQHGASKAWLWGIAVTVSFIAFVAAVFELGRKLGPWKLDERGQARPLVQRHGFWVMVAAAGLYLPFLGSYSLWDPWETHYGEVAREILARDDWISLWWAQEGWFLSKPILNFWIQSLAMAALGTHFQPGQMLLGARGEAIAHPEWVVRTPNFLMTAFAMYFLYKGVAKVFGRRAGLLGVLVLATMPDWFFLAHQTMTDMPFVASMTAAMGLLLLGLHTEDETRARAYEVKAGALSFRLTGWHLVMGVILVAAIPQILYLLSRNLELVLHGSGAHGFRGHFDQFQSGSGGGNCGLPGNEACTLTYPASVPKGLGPNPEGFVPLLRRFFGAFEPSLQALLWTTVAGLLLYLNWGERRTKRLYYLAAWFCAALATMAKGPAGFALPVICAFAYVCTKKHWAELPKLEIVSGLLIILAVAFPWHVAMYVRHGPHFTDQLLFHHMFNRAFHHVHDTNIGDDTSFRYYIWQLGYGIFPWTGLAPLGLLWWLRRSDSADRGKGDVAVFLAMWFIFAFALFTFMGTKFHHYIFPAVPPMAMLVGIVLSDMMRRSPSDDSQERARHEALMLSASAVAGAFVLGLLARDLAIKNPSEGPGAQRLLQLFTYRYDRAWPDTLDFSRTLTLFGVVAIALSLALAVRAVRRRAVMVFTGFAVVSALWGLDVYMVRLAPHWGQREIVQAYYQSRGGENEPLVAYQMNWKGENFYSGNQMAIFVSTGASFQTWIKQQREKGTRVLYLVTEHSRVGGLRSEVGARAYREVTDKQLNNKFVLVRAEF